MHSKKIITAGKKTTEAKKALIMIHGRGGSAEDILTLSNYLEVKDYALIAPQATGGTWYPYSFLMPPAQNEPWLSSALSVLKEITADVVADGISHENIYFLGFSQGACLTLEFVNRNADKYGGVVAFTGGLIGDKIYPENYTGSFANTPVFIGTSNPDPHVPVERVKASEKILQEMGADIKVNIYNNMGHTISQDEINLANELVFRK
ncbi:alpha/beta hydrolase [Chitinophaga filiformis]|uniref:Dienelactone hydrolase family protein n=1 Tax=Chitinophaga filiformis TaxID=104663 RepID=A0ABY4I9M8_CHIFI|nr:dienelactone hydrolase family protein [Chitinophaga filiformis]UPK72580.1 dienelactone hydrolase family protein [Chitinophaga filiformis]